VFTHALGKVAEPVGYPELSRSWLDEWLLGKLLAGVLRDLGLDEGAAAWAVGVVKILVKHQRWYEPEASGKEQADQALLSWLKDGEVQRFLQVNRYLGVLWFNHESFGQLLGWMLSLAAVEISANSILSPEQAAAELVATYEMVEKLTEAEARSEYQVAKLIEAMRG